MVLGGSAAIPALLLLPPWLMSSLLGIGSLEVTLIMCGVVIVVAFVAAGYLIYRGAKTDDGHIRLMTVLPVVIGCGALLFMLLVLAGLGGS